LYHRFKKFSRLFVLAIALVTTLSLTAMPVFSASKTSSSVKKTAKKSSKKSSKKCDTNYSGCVPVASDVDCKPGSGNGPKYQSTPVKILKKDIYRLDSDKDKIGCERN
jgi:hypothetical protein